MSRKNNNKCYSKFNFVDLENLGLTTQLVHLFEGATLTPTAASATLKEALQEASEFALDTEKARSEFIIAPILRELRRNNKDIFAVYSGFNFTVDAPRGLQGFCDFLLAKLPLNIVPQSPIIAVVEAKLNDAMSAAIPQCAAEMYAARIWNEKKGEPKQTIYGVVTTGNAWQFLRYQKENCIEIDKTIYNISPIENLLGTWQYIINQFK